MNTCRICGRREAHPSFKAREMMFGFRDPFTYFECAGCGCVQIETVPEDLSKYYPQGYYSFQLAGRVSGFIKRHRARYAYHRTGVIGAVLERVLGPHPALASVRRLKPARDAAILDVGSGNGELLSLLSMLGFTNLTGADPFIEREHRTPEGITLLKRNLADVRGQFDVVMMHQSLEHTVEPLHVVADVARLLKPGGVAILRVPVADSYAWKTYRADWVALDAPRHIVVPTVRGMTILADSQRLRFGDVVHDSTELQFWGSEQYQRDIPLFAPESLVNRRWALALPTATMRRYRAQTAALNVQGQGDTACFYFHRD